MYLLISDMLINGCVINSFFQWQNQITGKACANKIVPDQTAPMSSLFRDYLFAHASAIEFYSNNILLAFHNFL